MSDFYQKRKILFSAKTQPEKLRETGKQFMEAQRYDEALDFFERCQAEDLVRKIAGLAMEAGNVPLYMRAKKVLKEDVAEAEWTRIAGAAEKRESHTMAYVAHLKAGHEDEAARLRRQIQGAGEDVEPAGAVGQDVAGPEPGAQPDT